MVLDLVLRKFRVVDFDFKSRYDINDLLRIMRLLRGKGGCPWDMEQSHKSIKMDLIEEAYEAAEAIDAGSSEMLSEELGDLLLQVVFHSRIEEESGGFNFDDVCDEICKKLIVRHPHVFGEVNVFSADEVLKNWDSIKKESKQQATYGDTLKSVPKVFPALMKAQKLGRRASRAGVERDRDSLKEAALDSLSRIECGDLKENIGRILFLTANAAAELGINAEEALQEYNDRFVDRFCEAENSNELKGKHLEAFSIKNP